MAGGGERAGRDASPAEDEAPQIFGVLRPARAELRQRGSRFVGSLAPAVDASAAEAFAAAVARELAGATHHCRAQRLLDPESGATRDLASDAGEPAGTAGRPILDALSGAGLVNAVLVVSRWFGGVKLGKGGLARAYAAAARAAIAGAPVARLAVFRRVEVGVPYPYAGSVAAASARFGALMEAVSPAGEYRASVLVRADRAAAFEAALTELTGARASFVVGGALLHQA